MSLVLYPRIKLPKLIDFIFDVLKGVSRYKYATDIFLLNILLILFRVDIGLFIKKGMLYSKAVFLAKC